MEHNEEDKFTKQVTFPVRLAYKSGDIDYCVARFNTINEAELFLVQNRYIRRAMIWTVDEVCKCCGF